MADIAEASPAAARVDPGWRLVTGAAVLALGGVLAGALFGHSPADASLNAATGLSPSNPLGAFGAAASDLMIQLLGWGAWLAALALTAAGVKRTFAIGRPNAGHWGLGVLSIVLFMIAASNWGVPSGGERGGGWHYAVGLGGLFGDALLWLFATIPALAIGDGPARAVISFIAIGAAIVAGAAAAGVKRRDADAGLRTAWFLITSLAATLSVFTVWAGRRFMAGARALGERMESREGPDMSGAFAGVSGFLGRQAARFRKDKAAPEPHSARRPFTPVSEALKDDDFDIFADRDFDPPPWEDDADIDAPAPPPSRASDGPAIVIEPASAARDDDAEDEAEFEEARAEPKRLMRRKPFRLPGLDLLQDPPARRMEIDEAHLTALAQDLEGVLADFGVQGEITQVRPGPVVTLFEFEPARGTKTSRVIGLADDIARSMSAQSARVAVIHGSSAIGIELPNAHRETVYFRSTLASKAYRKSAHALPMILGETIDGTAMVADLAKMPHLLIAGTTGSGKSVGINAMILSLLYRHKPEECRMIMIDPKMLELSVYEGIPHLLSPVVIDPKKAVVALKWTVREMEERYARMAELGVRNIAGHNERVREALARGEKLTRTVTTGVDDETGEPIVETRKFDPEPLPFIVVVIDEMADLMMVAGKEIDALVQRLVQMARAAGIHVITATQRPSVDVITGTIKANFPTRISYMVRSKIDSRTILDEMGAEQLLGQGDLLYMASGGRTTRLHGPFVSDGEVEAVAAYLRSQGKPSYVKAVLEDPDEAFSAGDEGGAGGEDGNDLYDRAVAIVLRDRRASTSYIQRRLSIGYNRAASLIERMEQEGVVSAPNHAGKREIFPPGGDFD